MVGGGLIALRSLVDHSAGTGPWDDVSGLSSASEPGGSIIGPIAARLEAAFHLLKLVSEGGLQPLVHRFRCGRNGMPSAQSKGVRPFPRKWPARVGFTDLSIRESRFELLTKQGHRVMLG